MAKTRDETGRREDGGREMVLALLPTEGERDAAVLAALREVDPELRAARGADEARRALRDSTASLVVLDAAGPAEEATALRSAVADRDGPSPARVLLLLPAEAEPPEGAGHWLVRPFRAETLVALARALLERPAAASAGSGGAEPTLQLRRPGRFSARPLYGDAERYVREAFERARAAGTAPDMEAARLLAERLHTSLLQSNLLLLRALEPYKRFELPAHCANVAIIAGKIALGLEYPISDTLRVLQAGLLHDLGMMRLPDRILRKEGPLTPPEREEMQRHPEHGAEIVRGLGPEYEWLERAVAQEHERHGGQGYPEGRSGEAIDPVARILGVADVFEAFSHARAYRSPFTSYEALEKVIALRGEHFHPEVVDALTDEISVFPPDSYVLLSSGEIGRVVAGNPENLMRPTVEVLWDEDWTPLAAPREVPLADEPGLSIRRPLHEAEVPIT